MSTETGPQKKAIIVGAGPVGCLTALSLANRGWRVEVWEGRPDPRSEKGKAEATRSVNLAISSRGLAALHAIQPDLGDEFLSLALPMKGRMIWDFSNKQNSQLYDPVLGSCINSISRPLLSSTILSRAEAHPNINVSFEAKVGRVDWTHRRLYREGARGAWIEEGAEEGWDLLVGSDGNWSAVRRDMLKAQPTTYTQTQIPHVWIELHLPPGPPNPATGEDSTFLISPEHLHIWPRKDFMLIALPNKDKSFTMTLYAPESSITALSTRELVRSFFRSNFGRTAGTTADQVDIMSLMGEEKVIEDFEAARRGGLTSISVDPISYPKGAGVLLGDAAHSMVPFYGQGLNCGLEDVRVLDALLKKYAITGTSGSAQDLERALREFSDVRKADLAAILKLAMGNYDEMKSRVLSSLHALRRQVDALLSSLFPPPSSAQILASLAEQPTTPFPAGKVARWTSLYHLVTFRPDVGYAEAERREEWQKWVVERLAGGVVAGLGVGAVGWLVWKKATAAGQGGFGGVLGHLVATARR